MYEPDDPAGAARDDLSYDAYLAARRRFFAHLQADLEVRRLEALWLASDAPGGPDGARPASTGGAPPG